MALEPEQSILKQATRVERDDPRIAIYRTMRGTKGASENDFLCDGEKVVLRLLHPASRIQLKSLYCLPHYLERHANLIQASGLTSDQIFYSDRATMAESVGYRIHQGMMARAHKPAYLHDSDLHAPLLITNGVIAAENMGSLLRNAMAFGLSDFLTDTASCDPYLRRAVRVSMGSIFDTRVARTADLPAAMARLKARGITLIGSSARAGEQSKYAISIQDVNFPESFALLIGSEGSGLDPEIALLCDHLIYIPMQGGVSSLNAAAASAALLMAARLQQS